MKEETQKPETELEAPGERLERFRKSMQAALEQRVTTANQQTRGFHLTAQGTTSWVHCGKRKSVQTIQESFPERGGFCSV